MKANIIYQPGDLCVSMERPPINKAKLITEKEFRNRMHAAANDYLADNPEGDLDRVAMDLADSLLYDPEIMKFVVHHIGNAKRIIYKEYVAESIV